jgi:membrane-associated phospholipid phosphatase
LWLVLVGLVQVGALVATYVVFVRTRTGQLVDAAALFGTGYGRDRVDTVVERVLGVVSVTSLLVVIVVIASIALARRRPGLAAGAVAIVVLANGSAQVLKHDVLTRPEIDFYPHGLPINSLPSGHATVAMSLAVALTLVVSPRWRGTVAVLGATYAAVTGVATLSAGWHRPSDSVASFLVVGTCAAAVGLLLLITGVGETRAVAPRPGAVTLLLLVALAALAAAGLALAATVAWVDSPADLFGRGRLVLAYAGGAAGIVGVAAAVMAVTLSTTAAISDAAPAARVSGSRA